MRKRRHNSHADSSPPTTPSSAGGLPSSSSSKPRRLTRSTLSVYHYWFRYSTSYCAICLFRACFFGLFAVDMWLQIARAHKVARIGAFNVPHFEWLGSAMQMVDQFWQASVGRAVDWQSVYICSWLVQSVVGMRAALDCCLMWEYFLLVILNGFTYFSSQLDNYQHHYLLWLCLVLLSTINWPSLVCVHPMQGEVFQFKAVANTKEVLSLWRYTPNDRKSLSTVCCWQMRLLNVQLSIVYFFTALTKILDANFLTGKLLYEMVSPLMRLWFEWAASMVGLPLFQFSMIVCIGTVMVEMVLAVCLLFPASRTHTLYRYFICCLAIALHVGFGLSGFRIGRFSYYMVLFYIPLLPDHFWLVTRLGSVMMLFTSPPAFPTGTPPPSPPPGSGPHTGPSLSGSFGRTPSKVPVGPGRTLPPQSPLNTGTGDLLFSTGAVDVGHECTVSEAGWCTTHDHASTPPSPGPGMAPSSPFPCDPNQPPPQPPQSQSEPSTSFSGRSICVLASALAGGMCISSIPVEGALYSGIVSTLAFIVLIIFSHPTRTVHLSVVHFLCGIFLLTLFYSTHTVLYYYEQKAHQAITFGDQDTAVEYYTRVVQEFPRHADGYSELGFLYDMLQKPEKAAVQYRLVVNHLEKDNLKALVGLAGYYAQQGRSNLVCQMVESAHAAYMALHKTICNGERCENQKKFAEGFAIRQLSNLDDGNSCDVIVPHSGAKPNRNVQGGRPLW